MISILLGDVTILEAFLFLSVVMVSAIIAGFLAGLFGIGGGAVMVPVFSEIFARIGGEGTPFQSLAVSTSLAIIVVTGLQSARTHFQATNPDTGEKVMDLATLKKYLFFVPIGAVLGMVIMDRITQSSLVLIFAIIAGFIGVQTLFIRGIFRLSQGGPKTPIAQIGGILIGLTSALMGIGGGVLNNLFMTLQGTDLKRAIATSSAVGVLIAVPGTIGAIVAGWGEEQLLPFSLGYVNVAVFFLAIPITSLAAPVGARLTHSLPSQTIKTAFGFFLLVTAFRAAQKILAPDLLPF